MEVRPVGLCKGSKYFLILQVVYEGLAEINHALYVLKYHLLLLAIALHR